MILDLRTPPGRGFQIDAGFPGCVLRTTRGYRLSSLGDERLGVVRTPEEWVLSPRWGSGSTTRGHPRLTPWATVFRPSGPEAAGPEVRSTGR